MEVKRITRADGQRLFVELSKDMRVGDGVLPPLKKGDELLLMPARKLSAEQMKLLIGKYVQYCRIEEKTGFAMFFDGFVQKNVSTFWDGAPIEDEYALVDTEGGLDSFDDLNDVFDLRVVPQKKALFVNCTGHKCHTQISDADRYCSNCGKRNEKYVRLKK